MKWVVHQAGGCFGISFIDSKVWMWEVSFIFIHALMLLMLMLFGYGMFQCVFLGLNRQQLGSPHSAHLRWEHLRPTLPLCQNLLDSTGFCRSQVSRSEKKVPTIPFHPIPSHPIQASSRCSRDQASPHGGLAIHRRNEGIDLWWNLRWGNNPKKPRIPSFCQ